MPGQTIKPDVLKRMMRYSGIELPAGIYTESQLIFLAERVRFTPNRSKEAHDENH